MLRGGNVPIDQVVGWGVLPVCTPSFNVVQGRYRIPFLKGEVDPTLDKFEDFEDLYKKDLASWLCNAYVQVVHLPKEKMDENGVLQRDYDVEIDHNNQLLRLTNTTTTPREANEEEEDEEVNHRGKSSVFPIDQLAKELTPRFGSKTTTLSKEDSLSSSREHVLKKRQVSSNRSMLSTHSERQLDETIESDQDTSLFVKENPKRKPKKTLSFQFQKPFARKQKV